MHTRSNPDSSTSDIGQSQVRHSMFTVAGVSLGIRTPGLATRTLGSRRGDPALRPWHGTVRRSLSTVYIYI